MTATAELPLTFPAQLRKVQSAGEDQGKRGKKRSAETCRKISEAKSLRAAQRRALRPACLCLCGCGNPLPELVSGKTIYLRGHQPQPDRSTPEFRASMREGQKRRRANGWEVPIESRLIGARKTQATRAARKAAGRIYTTKGSAGKLRGRKWSPEIIEKRAAALRGVPKTAPRQAKGAYHHKAIHGQLRSAENKTYSFHNMSEFVRTHEHLFAPEDIQWNARRHCLALKGLLSLTGKGDHVRGSWKGWTLVSYTETFYNRGESLLSGESASQTNPPVETEGAA